MTPFKCLKTISIILPLGIFMLQGCGGGGTETTPITHVANDVVPIKTPENASLESADSVKTGTLSVDITDILGKFLDSRIELKQIGTTNTLTLDVPKGQKDFDIAQGAYKAYVSVYDQGIPYVVSTKDIQIRQNKTAYLLYELLEGAGSDTSLGKFDQDGDGFIGRVELAENTDPLSAISVPGIETLNWVPQRFTASEGWLRGELHARSNYGIGTESVADVIKRAEKLKLDFLAIMDRNTLAAPLDPDFKSKSVVLIPGLEWGDDDNGIALVYGPRSLPRIPESSAELSATIRFIQAQGGLVFASHPCFPIGSWNWNVNNLNGIQAWCMDWRGIPAITINQVQDKNRSRLAEDPSNARRSDTRIALGGRYTHPLAKAANLRGLSSNGQSVAYWDYELNRGLRLAAIGGSQTGNPKVDMAQPVTYVYAKEKSLAGILDGMRRGRTYISSGLDGPKIDWVGDIFNDGSIDVSIGGVIPMDEETRFLCRIQGAKGKKLQILLNGSPVDSKPILKDDWVFTYVRKPDSPINFRIRVVSPPDNPEKGFGLMETLAMTSPIYVRGVVADDTFLGLGQLVKIDNDYIADGELDKFMKFIEKNGFSLE